MSVFVRKSNKNKVPLLRTLKHIILLFFLTTVLFLGFKYLLIQSSKYVIGGVVVIDSEKYSNMYVNTLGTKLLPKYYKSCSLTYKVDIPWQSSRLRSMYVECKTPNKETGYKDLREVIDMIQRDYKLQLRWELFPHVVQEPKNIPDYLIGILSFILGLATYGAWVLIIKDLILDLFNDIFGFINGK